MKNKYVIVIIFSLNLIDFSSAGQENLYFKVNDNGVWCVDSNPKLCISDKYKIYRVSNKTIEFFKKNSFENVGKLSIGRIYFIFKEDKNKEGGCFHFANDLEITSRKKVYSFPSVLVRVKGSDNKNFGFFMIDVGLGCFSVVPSDELTWDALYTTITEGVKQ